MNTKKGNFTIIAGNKINFISDNINIDSSGDITNISSQKIVKYGEIGGRKFGDYNNYISLKDSNVIIKDSIIFRFYHTWVSTQSETNHIGSDYINIQEDRLITVENNGIETTRERFVTSYFAHVDDNNKEEIACSTWYYHDKTNYRANISEKNEDIAMKDIVIKYVKEVANYKKTHRGGSPVQAEAQKNRKTNKTVNSVSGAAAFLGIIIPKLPLPYAKITGKVIGGLKKPIKIFFSDPEHADEAGIVFRLKFNKIENDWEFDEKYNI